MLTLKSLDNISFDKLDHGLEGFLDSNSDVESSHTREYKLNLTSSLNSLKDLCIDDNISFDIIDQDYRPNSINSLTFISFSIGYSENFMKLCQLCSNLVYLKLMFYDTPNFSIIDKYLASDLTKLQHLKTLVLVDACNCLGEKFLDFTKFAQIENLKVDISFKSLLNIKFENCKSLKRVEFIGCDDTFDYEFESKFNQYKNWVFKFGDHIIKGYKI
ncbi:hypothetical protein CONCODRAFT_80416 [Conidiobolus coronatus NRRL 28638]|uniref:RNI-like protein n=1 Tax=Conidiobolus coronatus (strain ATCC 28846 / CBS 209.66 / NRRL 28638) TaxID=796925 RepID=A0A137NV77_CONC2|nr:hypothetical protein CONCODRAFT_80416 [Conidiobolus coronatus NRRL 28638]|eukprot:KXN66676.1 hypothetical protein CONCODRAFT_80416 [Conidiobolus coronatus NRRL 28638]